MKYTVLLGLFAVLSAVTKDYTISDFTKFEVSGSFSVLFKQNGSTTLRISASSLDILDRVVVRECGGFLSISLNPTFNLGLSDLRVTISNKQLQQLSSNGAVNLTVPTLQLQEDAAISLSGSTSARMSNLSAIHLRVSLSGKSSLWSSGSISYLSAGITGHSYIDMASTQVEVAEVVVSGSSTAVLNVVQMADVIASGVSTVNLTGRAVVRRQTSGRAEVNSAGDGERSDDGQSGDVGF